MYLYNGSIETILATWGSFGENRAWQLYVPRLKPNALCPLCASCQKNFTLKITALCVAPVVCATPLTQCVVPPILHSFLQVSLPFLKHGLHFAQSCSLNENELLNWENEYTINFLFFIKKTLSLANMEQRSFIWLWGRDTQWLSYRSTCTKEASQGWQTYTRGTYYPCWATGLPPRHHMLPTLVLLWVPRYGY